jgi:hypothetical protein
MNIDEQKARAAEEIANAKARVTAELAREKADVAAAFGKASVATRLPVDKLMHIAAGLLIWVVIFVFTRNIWFAAGAAVIAGAGKELYDAKHPATHTADFVDFVATAVLPCVLTLAVWGATKL